MAEADMRNGAEPPESENVPVPVAPAASSSERRGYELKDVSPRAVAGLILGVALVVIGTQAGLWELLRVFRAESARQPASATPIGERDLPLDQPRLQETPQRDYKEFIKAEEARLTSYGWTDKKQKKVHIPVSRAIDLVLERGLRNPRLLAPRQNMNYRKADRPSIQ